MNWRNAKSLTLIFLIILNIFLGVLVYANREDYRLTSNAEQAIFKLLENSQIKLQSSIPKEYKPLGQLIMSPGSYDTDTFLNMFFSEPQTATITLEYDKTIYKTANETLVFQNDNVNYTANNLPESEPSVTSAEKAIELCGALMAKGLPYLSGFYLDRCVPSADRFIVEYRQKYKTDLVFSSYFIFTVTENGIVQATCRYDKAMSFDGKKKEIISPDRALFILMKHINNEYENKEVTISLIDTVYIQNETSVNADASLKASPYYRMYYSESDLPFFINAYTGDIFEYFSND